MEASVAAPAAASGGEAQQQGQPAEGEAQQPSLGDLSQTLDGLGQLLEEQRSYLQSEPWHSAAEPQAEPEAEQPPDFSFLDEAQPGYTQEAAAQQLAALIDSTADKRVSAALSPLQEQLQEMQVKQASDALITRYPQLGEQDVAETVVDTARKWAESIGKPELGQSPELWELVYLAGRSRDDAGGQEGAQPSAATLEGAGGASPGGAAQGEGPTTGSVTDSWRSNRLPLFSGNR